MKYFKNVDSLEKAKKEFRRLCMALHPDRGGNAADFVEMSEEYKTLLASLEAGGKSTAKDTAYESAAVERYKAPCASVTEAGMPYLRICAIA